MLLPPGAESHSFEPTPRDIINIRNSDVFIYVGGESDVWVDRILESVDTSRMKILSLMDTVEVVQEEIVEGMEDEHGHEHGHGEIDPDHVKDRPLNDFAGSWTSGAPFLRNGSLDAYVAHRAEETGQSPEEARTAMLAAWASDYRDIRIAGNTVSIGGRGVPYAYQGYEIVESDHGVSVWYKYQISVRTPGFPGWIMFNDHGDGNEEEEHGEEEEGPAHLHIKYGDDGFASLIAREDWTPMYFAAGSTAGDIVQTLTHHDHEHEEEEREYDEHVWTSPQNAKLIVRAIAETLAEADRANAGLYRRNADSYIARLNELDAEFQAVVNSAGRRTIVFGDRFPFRYFVDAYRLSYFAAFPGCSTETEPSAATIAFLINKIKSENIPVVFHIELSNERMADAISAATGAKKLLFHACHNISRQDFDRGVTYLELQKDNVARLREALR
jgi:zinc transport system substrate-binding protein